MTVGQTFRWSALDGTGCGVVVVVAFRSDRQEGMSPEVESYAARWMEARPISDGGMGEVLMFLLGTDDFVYLDGTRVALAKEKAAAPCMT